MAPCVRGGSYARGKRPVVDSPHVANSDKAATSIPCRSTRRSRKEPVNHVEEALASCQVKMTRFIDWERIDKLGLLEGLDEIFGILGIQTYVHRKSYMYEDETQQFMRTMTVEFTINRKSCRFMLDEVRSAYGFHAIAMGELEHPSEVGMRVLWRILFDGSSTTPIAPGTSASYIRNPLLRYAQKALGEALFGRDKIGLVLRDKWRMLCSAVHTYGFEFDPAPQYVSLLDPAYILLVHLCYFQERLRYKMVSEGWKLCIGGILTPLMIMGEVPLGAPPR